MVFKSSMSSSSIPLGVAPGVDDPNLLACIGDEMRIYFLFILHSPFLLLFVISRHVVNVAVTTFTGSSLKAADTTFGSISQPSLGQPQSCDCASNQRFGVPRRWFPTHTKNMMSAPGNPEDCRIILLPIRRRDSMLTVQSAFDPASTVSFSSHIYTYPCGRDFTPYKTNRQSSRSNSSEGC